MLSRYLKICILVLVALLCTTANLVAQDDAKERHIQVAMRMVGHQILLSSGDSVSIVSPIEKEGDRYKIKFQTAFAFNPDELKEIVDSVFEEARIATGYIVEVKDEETELVVYSYEIGNNINPSFIPCKTRSQPKAAYSILITILEEASGIEQAMLLTAASDKSDAETTYFGVVLLCIGFVVAIGLVLYFWRRKPVPQVDSNIIVLGDYQFDKRNLNLSYNNKTTELTSKEADLLALLHSSANSTITREDLLKDVWGDEGDYVGRTLDVFISKLRKKLEADARVKIVNVRGVGYRLILNV